MKKEKPDTSKKFGFSFSLVLVVLFVTLAFFGRVAFLEDTNPDRHGVDYNKISLQASLPAGIYPLRDWSVGEPEIGARSYLVFYEADNELLTQKDIHKALPIASLTKLMTAFLVREDLIQEDFIEVPELEWLDLKKYLQSGSNYNSKKLFQAMVACSNNEAAYAFADYLGEGTSTKARVENFVGQMNEKAKKLGLSSTHFENPAGFDNEAHYSSARDILVLVNSLADLYPSVFETSLVPRVTLGEGENIVTVYNTNQLVGKVDRLWGQKTGHTKKASGTMVLIEQGDFGKIIYVILGTDNRAEDMRRLINWTHRAYKFRDVDM